MPTTPDFSKMVPGFDFLQTLMKGAGASLPGMGQWIAPTLDAEEVDRRIKELRTVQFWLEQNARMLGATIQALEVQRMTLATLRTMNLPLADLGQAMKLDPQAFMPAPPPAAAEPTAPEPAPAPAPAPAAVDPMQWWSALTQQFTELAANAIKDTPLEGALATSAAAGPAAGPGAARSAASKSAAKSNAKTAAKTTAKTARRARPRP